MSNINEYMPRSGRYIRENGAEHNIIDNGMPIDTYSIGGYSPEAGTTQSLNPKITVDSIGNLVTRSTVLTDEGGFREGFLGTYIGRSLGTSTFTFGSTIVTGSGFTSGSLQVGDYVKLNNDSEMAWTQIDKIISDTQLELTVAYTGTGGTDLGDYCKCCPSTGPGATITVGSDQLTIGSGIIAGSKTCVFRSVDYGPLVMSVQANISQRVSNQAGYIGFVDDPVNPLTVARFRFDGTNSYSVVCESSFRNSAVKEQTSITMPSGFSTATIHRYRIEVTAEIVAFYIGLQGNTDDILVARHRNNIPEPYARMQLFCGFINTSAPSSSTNMVVEYVYVNNFDSVEIKSSLNAIPTNVDQAPAQVIASSASSLNGDIIAAVDVSKFRSIVIHISNTWSGTITFQVSNDTVNWFSQIAMCTGPQISAPTPTAGGNGAYLIPVTAKFFRARMTAYTSGTANGSALLTQNAIVPIHSSVSIGSQQVPLYFQAASYGNNTNNYRLLSTATTNATNIKASAGRMCMFRATNLAAGMRYIKFYNKASAPVVGTDTPIMTIPVFANSSIDVISEYGIGIYFSIGISFAITGALVDNDTTAVGANDVVINATWS